MRRFPMTFSLTAEHAAFVAEPLVLLPADPALLPQSDLVRLV